MKRNFWLFCAAIIALAANGCYITSDDDGFGCLRGEGPTVTETLNLPNFQSIDLSLSADVFITQGSVQKVEVEGQSNLIAALSRDVSGGTWKIKFDRRCVRNASDLRIYITLTNLSGLNISGSGSIVGGNVFDITDLALNISGSGDVNLALDARDIDATISGSGKITLRGQADFTKYRISGSGDVHAFNLECRTADVNVSGSGNCEVFAKDYLKVRVSGSGDVFYKGSPALEINISGSGKVIDRN
jgi:hypothetical protein